MELVATKLNDLLAKWKYFEVQKNVEADKCSLQFARQEEIQLNLNGSIYVRLARIPFCKELMVYIKADHLLRRIVSMKISLTAEKEINNQVNSAVSEIILSLFPTFVTIPSISFLPETCLDAICQYLEVKQIIHFGYTCTKLAAHVFQNRLLWISILERDFPIDHVDKNNTCGEILREYRSLYKTKLANIRITRTSADLSFRQYQNLGFRQHSSHVPYPFVPSPIAGFVHNEDDHPSLLGLDDFNSVPFPFRRLPAFGFQYGSNQFFRYDNS